MNDERRLSHAMSALRMLQFERPEWNATTRRLRAAHTIEDLRRIAKRATPPSVFDYADGAAEAELSIARSRELFTRIEFQPEILRDVSAVSTEARVFGKVSAQPYGIAPTGFTRLMHSEGENAVAAAAATAGIPFSLSTLGTVTPERVAEINAHGLNWFQLYMMRDPEVSFDLMRRASASGFDVLLVTVDTPVPGARLRDLRNGFSIPPRVNLKTVAGVIPRPRWWIDFLTKPPLEFASLTSLGGAMGEQFSTAVDPSIDWADFARIRERWPGKVVVKGVQTAAMARRLADEGVDGIVLSSHGGRQLDRSPLPLTVLPEVAREVGDRLEIILDSGVMSGADIVAAHALGADFVLVGRAYLYGLMAGGRAGVDRALEILSDQVKRTMQLLQVTSVDELRPEHVKMPG